MTRLVGRMAGAGALALLIAAPCFAQGPGGQGPGGGQFGQMREKYKYTFQLMSMARHIGEIDKDPKYALSPVQAKQTLAVLQPLRSKSKLSQDQAKQALRELKPIFTVNQLNAMARIKPPQRRPGQGGMGMGGPGGRGGPGGPGRPGGTRRMDPNAMKDFNPFYAKSPAGAQFGAQRMRRWNEFFTGLQMKAKAAKGAKAIHPTPYHKRGSH